MSKETFSNHESAVRSYCRSFPDVFDRAKGSELFSESGKRYIDFLSGAGALNYGHNNDFIKKKLVEYIEADLIMHALDFHTSAKAEFLEELHASILAPKGFDYRVQFCGPTGTNAVEAALKLARKVKNRTGIFAFTGAYHGMTLASLAATGSKYHRAGSGVPLNNVTRMPFPHGFMNSFDTIAYIDELLADDYSGIEKPAAILLETIQAEGGVIVASSEWLQRLRSLCDQHDILMICDDIQVGCGRTGPFFSFEEAGIVPDMVLLSKSIGGYGQPAAMILLKPELDIWKPGEHNGTFRGNQLSFVAGSAALQYRAKHNLRAKVQEDEEYLFGFLNEEILSMKKDIEIRGKGLMWGIDFAKVEKADAAGEVVSRCFEKGLIIENTGRNGAVVKILPPLTIERTIFAEGLQILHKSIVEVVS